MPESDVDVIVTLAMGIMSAVYLTGILEGADDDTLSYAGNVARGELKALLVGEGEYGEALQGVANGTVSDAHPMSLVVATCIERIAAFREAG